MTPETVKRYSAPVPRYTSYPTAPNFTPDVNAQTYRDWLAVLPDRTTLSLYAHIPFCETLCWYCGCSTKAVRSYDPVAAYLTALHEETGSVATVAPRSARVTNMHWGGGTPNILAPADILRLADVFRAAFMFGSDAEFAVEIDPRGLDGERIAAFAAAGVNRVSIGVQDFDPDVQRAINRVQDFEATRRAIEEFRARGVPSINIDLIYGLPHQSRASVASTIERVLELQPDRIAAFGYAHLPARIKHQRLIEEAALPDAVERFGQSRRIARRLASAGYVQVGLDHFARPEDPLALQAEVRRNFQGYTRDPSQALLGLGASAIGQLPQGYVQNASARGEYAARVRDIGLATVRGFELSTEDRARAFVIEELMCRFAVRWADVEQRFGIATGALRAESEALAAADTDGIVSATRDEFCVLEPGRPFVRSVCACFDSYLGAAAAQHALAV